MVEGFGGQTPLIPRKVQEAGEPLRRGLDFDSEPSGIIHRDAGEHVVAVGIAVKCNPLGLSSGTPVLNLNR